ncbi:unnamed protein product [Phytomonas sp. Hart1]|nr:unnamed protein product [Phytomonas sp. Hart1]|eukprot:CCW69792.1 unnamed protein product [Phytomonas sp. isolate Hart1]
MTEVDCKTYSDDVCFGKDAPSIDLLEPIKGDKVSIAGNEVCVLYFFNTFYRGADICNNEFTQFSEKFADKATIIAISTDADRAKTEKYLGKDIVDENTKKPLRLDPPHIVFDNRKEVSKEFAGVSGLSVMSCPMGFIVKDKKIVWRQQFLQSFTFNQSNFEAQFNHILAGEKLESNGPRPKVVVEEEEAEGMDGDISLF